MVGTLKYNSVAIAIGSMAYKYQEVDLAQIQHEFESKPNFLLKIIPHVNGEDVKISLNLTRFRPN